MDVKIYATTYDCIYEGFVLVVKRDKKYGLYATDGQVIIEPMSDKPIVPLTSGKYKIEVNGNIEYLEI